MTDSEARVYLDINDLLTDAIDRSGGQRCCVRMLAEVKGEIVAEVAHAKMRLFGEDHFD